MAARSFISIRRLDPVNRPDRLLRMSSARTKEPAQPGRYHFSLDEYHDLVETGFFKREDRIQLIEGELIMMPPHSPEHSANSTSLRRRIERVLPDHLLLREAQPVSIPPNSEPEPDLSVVKMRPDFYKSAHPVAKDVLLLVEVAKTSAPFDKGIKAQMYAKAGIAEYWVIEIMARVVTVFTEPSAQGYRTQRTLQPEDKVQCGTIKKLALKVSDMLL